jgi:hypothetical protein
MCYREGFLRERNKREFSKLRKREALLEREREMLPRNLNIKVGWPIRCFFCIYFFVSFCFSCFIQCFLLLITVHVGVWGIVWYDLVVIGWGLKG